MFYLLEGENLRRDWPLGFSAKQEIICAHRLLAKVADHVCDLAAVIASMMADVRHDVDESKVVWCALACDELNDLARVNFAGKIQHFVLHGSPDLLQGSDVCELPCGDLR